MIYPTYRDRYLPALTRAEVDSLPTKEKTPVILPVGAIEQHGPHLPVGVDALIGQARLDYALPRLPKNLSLLVAPAIQIGKSNEHTGFPGTLAISKTVLRRQLLAIAGQLSDWGFRCLLILNTHGGNKQVINYTVREIRDSLGMDVRKLQPSSNLEIDPQEAAYGFHAGEIETNIMLEILDGQRVDLSHATCEFPAWIDGEGRLRPESAPAIYSWVTSDLSDSGVMGNARAATPEAGKAWVEAEAESLVTALKDICRELQGVKSS
ncbi:MAG TPA: creatininase family protein [Oceanipulchritudo sp.]|nr:creatininase family protein [Oceanipulchritudo sp.]